MKFEFSGEEREAFFERHFDYEAEDAENRAAAERVFTESSAKVTTLTEQLVDGEVVDEKMFVRELSNMILANEYRNKF